MVIKTLKDIIPKFIQRSKKIHINILQHLKSLINKIMNKFIQ